MKKFILPILFVAFALAFSSCKEDEEGPNELGGSTTLDYTEPGREIYTYLSIEGEYNEALSSIADSMVITKNENGIVTTYGQFILNPTQYRTLDTLFGTQSLGSSVKNTLLDYYLGKIGASLDTTNKEAVKLSFEVKGKVTSEGIQDFVHSGGDLSKPFTVVKYDNNVGDSWTFTDNQGVKYTRKVVSKSTTEDYSLGFLLIKTIRVEETSSDNVIDKITYIANHKFGFVGVQIKFKSGKTAKLGFI